MKHVAPSKARIAILGDYLIAVSKSIVVDQSSSAVSKKAARNRMDLLLIVNDVLHTDKFHCRSTMKQSIFGDECQGFVVELIEQAAACIPKKASQLELKLRAIINYWTVNKLLSVESLKTCQDKADEALSVAQGDMSVRKRNYLLPEFHGDRNAPWHELPASYMLEPMIKYPKRPINPSMIEIQKLDKKPVSSHVRKLLDNFFEKIDSKYLPTGDNPTGETIEYMLSLNPAGGLLKVDKVTGKKVMVANPYGWSLKFCRDMRKFGVPENIKIAREDLERMEDMQDPPFSSVSRRDDRPHRPSTSSSAESDYRRERKRYNRRSRSPGSYDGDDGHGMSRDGALGRRITSPHPRFRHQESEGRGLVEPRPSSRASSRAYDADRPRTLSQWSGSNRNTQSSPGNHQQRTPPMPQQNYAQSYSQAPQPPFNAPPFPPQQLSGQFQGQFQGQFPMSMPPFGVPPPPPPQFQGPGDYVPPPPPLDFRGVWRSPAPSMNMPSNGPQHGNQQGNQYRNQYGNQHGNPQSNQYGNQQANQYGNTYGNQGGNQYGNNGQYGQNRGGYQGGRGGYGGGQRGGFNGNRGGWRGNGRGGRY